MQGKVIDGPIRLDLLALQDDKRVNERAVGAEMVSMTVIDSRFVWLRRLAAHLTLDVLCASNANPAACFITVVHVIMLMSAQASKESNLQQHHTPPFSSAALHTKHGRPQDLHRPSSAALVLCDASSRVQDDAGKGALPI